MADHLQTIRVTGHIEDRRGIFHIILNWKDTANKRIRKYISTGLKVKGNKRRAEEILRDACTEQEQLLAGTEEPLEILFADFLERWLEVIKPDIKMTTFGSYQKNVKNIIAPWFRERSIMLHELTANDINEFYSAQLERVKAASVHKYHANISKAIKYAVTEELLPCTIMDKVKKPKAERFIGKFLKQSEVIELFEAVKGHKLELGVILGAFYGLRRGEIVGLRWEAIDFDANTITIEHTVTKANVDGKVVIVAANTTKTKSSHRTLPLVPSFRAKLLAVREEQQRWRKLCGNSYNKKESQYIYIDQLGNRINPSYLTEEFPIFLEKNGFRRIRFHDLRHSSASLLIASGVPLKQIQEWPGHSDYSVTADTYTHLEYESKQAAANAMKWIEKTSLGA